MSATIDGIVKNGVVIPNAPLPEGAHVEIRLRDAPLRVPPEFAEESSPRPQAGANALTFGKYQTGQMSTLEDFQDAEWRGEEAFEYQRRPLLP
jgi:hypothetical protein